MEQDFRKLPLDDIEEIEKQTLRVATQAVQQYSREARDIFQNTPAPSATEVIVLAEDLVQYALEVAEIYPINVRFAGFIDYKRVRWMPSGAGLFPQAFLVDAKASTENFRTTLQRSQLPMDADFASKGTAYHLKAGLPAFLPIQPAVGNPLVALTTSLFIHFHYSDLNAQTAPYRTLHAIYLLAAPHQSLKARYNPDPTKTFFGQGKHAPSLGEDPRIRIYFGSFRSMCAWRLQELRYLDGSPYTQPVWRDVDPMGREVETAFQFIGR